MTDSTSYQVYTINRPAWNPRHSPSVLIRRSAGQGMLYSQLQAVTSPIEFPASEFESIEISKIEEETLPTYKAKRYYPAQIGQIINNRYQIVGKLGYGTTSTVWLCRDMQLAQHVELKICISEKTPNREIQIYKHLNFIQSQSDHCGKQYYRSLYDSFEITGPYGRHTCLVHQQLGLSLFQVLDIRPKGTLTIELLKPPLRQILIGLDILHSVGIIHTDLQPQNMNLEIHDPDVFSVFEQSEVLEPAPRKILEDRIIYKSRRITMTPRLPIITDFGEARFADKENREDIMPDQYRAPEVILQMKWDNKVDIWGIGMVFWDLVAGRTMFYGRDDKKLPDDSIHLAEMIAIMGPPPIEFLRRSEASSLFWDKDGKWGDYAPIPDISLESLAEKLEGENKEGFLSFLRTILKWLPEERPTAEELVYHPWLMEGLKSRNSDN
ncbi:hypothetical protein FQN57_007390 [Myotisia sp. PD_48]|nr:hypothetical protein FQN57_007390 [Myotisia sp. PD_48]